VSSQRPVPASTTASAGGFTFRALDEEEARAMIVRGFVEPIAKELPLEYAVEMNNLVNIELEGTMG